MDWNWIEAWLAAPIGIATIAYILAKTRKAIEDAKPPSLRGESMT